MIKLGSVLRDKLSEFTLPTLGKDVEIAVYLIHNSRDPEDYFFLFDFEEFVERSQGGMFVRPLLRIYGGRDDFSRTVFARQFRTVFASEFDRMRAELAQSKRKRGWLSWNFGFGSALLLVGGFVGNLILAIALSAGKPLLREIGTPRFLKGRSSEAKLADEIDETKSQVEAALKRIDITIHRELFVHAYQDGPLGKNSGLDRNAWPLPGYVRAHLQQGQSGSWW